MTDDHERGAVDGATVKDDDQGGGLVLVAGGGVGGARPGRAAAGQAAGA